MPYKQENREIWGIDIGSTCIRAVKLARLKEGVKLVDYDIRELSYQGRDEQKTLEAVRKALVGLAGRKSLLNAKVVISIPGAMCFQRVVKIPPCPLSKVPEIMNYEARQQVPSDLGEIIWDYQLLSAPEDVSQGRKVALFAVKRSVVEPLLAFCREAMMKVVGIQLTHLALLNFLVRERTDDEPFAVLDVGGRHTEFVVVDPSSSGEFSMRPLNISGVQMTETLAERRRLSFIEAEQAKVAAMSGEGEVPEALDSALMNIASEINRSLGYFKSQFLAKDVSRVFVTGRGIGFETGMDALKKKLGRPLRMIEAPNRFAFTLVGPAEVFFDDCRQLGVAFGLALQGLGESFYNADLLPASVRFDNILADKRVPVAIGLGVLWLALVSAWFFMGSQLDATVKKNNTLKKAVDLVNAAEGNYEEVVAQIPPIQLKAADLASHSHGRDYPLLALNRVLDSAAGVNIVRRSANGPGTKVWLSSFSIADDSHGALREWAASLGENPIYSSIEQIIMRKTDYIPGMPEEDSIFGYLQPSRVSRAFSGLVKGEALVGEDVNIYWVEKFKDALTGEGSPISSATLLTGWREVVKTMPDGSEAGVVEFEIQFRVIIPPFDAEWNMSLVPEIPEELQ